MEEREKRTVAFKRWKTGRKTKIVDEMKSL